MARTKVAARQISAAPRIGTTTSASTVTADADNHDQYNVTALATNPTFAAPSGSPADGQKLVYRIKDNGTGRTISWNSIFRAVGVAMPTASTAGKTMYVGFIYNSADTKWDCVSYTKEA